MWRLILLLIIVAGAWGASPTIEYRAYAGGFPLLLSAPVSYNSPSLVLTLHGAGETGNGSYNGTLVYNSSTNAVAATLVHGAMQCVNSGVTWFSDHNVLVAAPQCTSSWSVSTLETTVAALVAEYGVNTSRICVTGLSLGGYGAWTYALAHPSRCYSLVPIAGAGFPGAGTITTFGGIKIYYVHDADDGTVPPAWNFGTDYVSQPYVNAWLYEITGSSPLDIHSQVVWSTHAVAPHLSGVTTTQSCNWNGSAWAWTAGATLPTGTLGATLYTSGGHGGWDPTYGTGPGDFNTAFWTWALGVQANVSAGPLMALDQ